MFVFLLVACQTGRQTVSLHEAKQISLRFSDASFEPPPRSISDLKMIIDDYLFEREIPTCITMRPRQSLSEISESLRAAKGSRRKILILSKMAESEMNNGNYTRCVNLQKMAIASVPDGSSVLRGNQLAALSKYYAYAGDFKPAERALKSALSWYNQSNYDNEWKRYYQYSGKALIEQMQGRLLHAEQYFKKAIEACFKVGKHIEVYSLKANLAENLMRQGRLMEAEILARESVLHFRKREGGYVEGKNLLVLSRILFEQGRYIEAEYTARASINKYLLTGTDCSSVFLNISRQTTARILMAQERWEEAVSQFDAIREGMKDDPEAFEARFSGDVDWALALFKTGRTSAAANMLRTGLDRTSKKLGEKHYQTAEIRGLIALINAAEGRRKKALEGFKESVSILLARSNQTGVETFKISTKDQRLSLILEGYMNLLANILNTPLETESEINAADIAFSMADVARNRSIRWAVDASSARTAVKDPEFSDLTRREQDAGQQLSALYGALNNAVSQRFSDQDPKLIQALREKIDKLSNARLALIKEIESRFPKYAT